ncbi:unnamed protein product [Orchesella dallaii]|uniref:Odorant receptor n=1 Tax=Orchesella dallaii TaxID=48710 RepID=A0ABP1Q7L2_9HEXA
MSFSTGFLRVQIVLQKLMGIPINYDTSRHILYLNPHAHSWKHMVCWKFGKVSYIFFTLFTFIKLLHLVASGKWESEMEQMVVYSIANAFSIFSYSTVWTVEHLGSEVCWVVSQQLLLERVHEKGNKRKFFSLLRLLSTSSIKELAVYIFTLCFAYAPIVCAAFPFFRNYCPVQSMFSLLFPSLIPELCSKIIASIWNGATLLFGYVSCVSFFLAIVASIECEKHLLKRLKQTGSEKHSLFRKESSEANFNHAHCPFYRQMQIIVTQSNINVSLYCPSLIAIGFSFSISGYLTCFKFYDRIPLFVYCFCTITGILMTFLFMILVPIAAEPNELSNEFVGSWRTRLRTRQLRMQLRSCMPFAYTIGPFLLVKRCTLLDMLNSIMDYTTSFILV